MVHTNLTTASTSSPSAMEGESEDCGVSREPHASLEDIHTDETAVESHVDTMEYADQQLHPPLTVTPSQTLTRDMPSATTGNQLDDRLRAIEAHNRDIQAQLTSTQEMIQTLTTMVQALQQPQARVRSPGPDSALLDAAEQVGQAPANVTTTPCSAPSPPRKASNVKRQRSAEDLDSMTRIISTKGIPIVAESHDTLSPLSLASAVKVVQRIARAASKKTLRVPDMIVPMMTRRFTVSSLNFDRSETTQSRRIARWSRSLFNKSRVEPTVTKTDVIKARLEDMPMHPYTIRHDSNGRAAWDTFVLVMIIVDVVMTPLSLSFRYMSPSLVAFNMLATVGFSIDFIVQALSSYTTERGIIISGPSNTISHYLTSVWALADFLSCFPFEYIVARGRFLGVAKVVRLVKISQLMRRFHSNRKAGMFRLIRLISIVLLVSHCLSCYWNWVAVEWRQNEDGYLDKSILNQYIHSWSIVIGSLNASPPTMHTPIEELSVAVFMLIGNVLQASVFGSVAVLIQSFDEEEVVYNKKLIDTYERCKLLDIPETLANRISSYYEHLYRETRSVDPDADAFINELSPALVSEVKFQLYRDMVKQIPFFSSANINPVLIEALILKLRTVIYMQDDMLIRKGEFGDWMGFIGSKGSVGVLDPNSETHKIVRILRKGEYFGEMGLLHRSKRTTTAVALSWVQIHVLSRTDLDQVKDQYIEDAENLEQEIRKYMRSRVSSVIGPKK